MIIEHIILYLLKRSFTEAPLSCSFETTSLCGWNNDANIDDFNWHWQTGHTPTKRTGPERDHTYEKDPKRGMLLKMTCMH